MPKASRKKARVVSSRISYRGPVFWVTTDDVLEPTGIRARRDVVRHSGSVVVLAVDESSGSPRVLLEKQYRHAAGRFLLELPAGRIDEGENELHAAKRELLEETGYAADEWTRLTVIHTAIAYTDEAIDIFLARRLRKLREAALDAGEFVDTLVVPFAEAIAMVRNGRITDAKSVAALLWTAAWAAPTSPSGSRAARS